MRLLPNLAKIFIATTYTAEIDTDETDVTFTVSGPSRRSLSPTCDATIDTDEVARGVVLFTAVGDHTLTFKDAEGSTLEEETYTVVDE